MARLAAAIPDDTLRHDALRAIDRKRANIDGAALFWVLPRHRNPNLLRLLVAYEILADFLDCTSERGAHVGVANGLRLHSALRDALDPAASDKRLLPIPPVGTGWRVYPPANNNLPAQMRTPALPPRRPPIPEITRRA